MKNTHTVVCCNETHIQLYAAMEHTYSCMGQVIADRVDVTMYN